MRKTSSLGKICTYCDNPATPLSDPPTCELCQLLLKLSSLTKLASQADTELLPSSKSLKELLQ